MTMSVSNTLNNKLRTECSRWCHI